MHDQRRFIVTKTERIEDKVVPTRGYFIGAGNRSVVSIVRNAQLNLIHNIRRAAAGRYNWWNVANLQVTNDPLEPASRQVRRQMQRQAAKAA